MCVRERDRSNGGWQEVRYRKIAGAKENFNPYHHLDNVATTYFISNIPDGWAEADIWRILKEYGRIVYFYLASCDEEG